MASLQDQLLKAGLTTKQKARQANTDRRKKNKQKRSGVDVGVSLQEQIKQDLAKQQAEKQAKDAQLEAQKQQALVEKEQYLRILQILEHHQIKNVNGENEYNYTFDNKVKKLYVDNVTQQALIKGRLALCGLDQTTYIVTSETADKIATLDEKVVLLKNDKVEEQSIDEDDPYAEFQIPDDLMW
ncbi:DUF2058 domain-containing protein [Thalassotalea atypica]|uniref:DUF2058 domain-containing protein n=1 Tax=Thalassotalea atypica TaxID=2054316 RepID=UPI002572F801|nr:DUF2058 domain-containing protein [Thalassotalea atypica]